MRAGNGGTKADLFRLSQPRGAVMTTSSKTWVEPQMVRSSVLGFSLSVGEARESIDVTVLENWMSA